MSEYKDVIQFQPKPNGDGFNVQKLGYAKEDNSGRLRVRLTALPVPVKNRFDEYTVELVISEPRERDGGNRQAPPPPSTPGQTADPADDNIPF